MYLYISYPYPNLQKIHWCEAELKELDLEH